MGFETISRDRKGEKRRKKRGTAFFLVGSQKLQQDVRSAQHQSPTQSARSLKAPKFQN
jgi:hypothetical protein